MRIPRIFQTTHLNINDTISLTASTAHHVVTVLRLKIGNAVIVFNGQGGEYCGEIVAITKRDVQVKLTQYNNVNRESPLQIHLGQVLARGEKMDFILQKAVELGVSQITPLWSEHCNVQLPQDRLNKRFEHWQSVIISACEQSGRTSIPLLNPVKDFSAWVSHNTDPVKLLLEPSVTQQALTFSTQPSQASVLIGPEGGFSQIEIDFALAQGFTGIQLGTRILRTETTGIVIVSILQTMFGDFKL